MFILLIPLYIEISNFINNLIIYETCVRKLMVRGSKGLKIKELLDAYTTSSESIGQQNDDDTQEK